MRNLTILGGGPAGLAVAYYGHLAGMDLCLFEKSAQAGGLCRTLTCGKHSYDTGAHRLHNRDPEITRDLKELLGDQLFVVDKPSKVLISGQFLDFPPTPLNMLQFAGLRQVGRIGFDLIKSRRDKREIKSFADFANRSFGQTLAQLFLTNYSEKVWGLPADQLSPVIATRRLSGMNLWTLFIELISPGKKTAHLDGQFLYPRGGYGKIVDVLEQEIPDDCVRLEHEIVGLSSDSNRISKIHFSNEHSHVVKDRLVSTLPLDLLVRTLEDQIPGNKNKLGSKLRFRSIRLIFLRLDQTSFSGNASIYVPDPKYCISRIYEPRNRCRTMSPAGETGIVLECPCFENDSIGRLTSEALYNRVVDELEDLGVIKRNSIIEWRHHFLPDAYPVYSLDYAKYLERSLELVRKFDNLDTLGRNGLFFYSHLHDQLRFGKDYISDLGNASHS